MKYKQAFITLLLPFQLSTPMPSTQAFSIAMPKFALQASHSNVEVKEPDPRTVVLRAYFEKYHSPLVPHAQDFIDAADEYDVDWKLVPAITGVESTFGKNIPGGHDPRYTTYNGWGWGVYGTQTLGFKSWRDGIFTVTKGLKENYINKGLTDPYSINKVYAASPSWGRNVTYFINDITEFEKEYAADEKLKVEYTPVNDKIAGVSAQLASK